MPIVLRLQSEHWAQITELITVTAMTSAGTPECVEGLWQMYLHGRARGEAVQSLKIILPQLNAEWCGSDDALLGLAKSKDVVLALAALDALEKAGGGSSTKAVERLAKTAWSSLVRERAAALVPILAARHEQERASSTLLRPSFNNRQEHLVRPVYSNDPNVTNLLRASNAGTPSAPESPQD